MYVFSQYCKYPNLYFISEKRGFRHKATSYIDGPGAASCLARFFNYTVVLNVITYIACNSEI